MVQIRRCKLCGKTGHNRAKCLLLIKNSKVENTANLKQNIELSKPIKSVLIKAHPEHLHSQHVVNLKKEENQHVWNSLPGFTENKKDYSWQVADLGKMVKQANEKKTVHPVKSPVVRFNRVNKIKLPKLNIGYNLANLRDAGLGKIKVLLDNLKTIKKFFTSKRFAYAVVLIFFLASLPFPAIAYYNSVKDTSAKVTAQSTNAFLSLKSSTVAAMQDNILQAQADLNSALKAFGEADNILQNEHQLLQYVVGLLPIVGDEINGRENLLTAGHYLALGNTYLMKGIGEVNNSTSSLTDRLTILTDHLQSATVQYQNALNKLADVDPRILPLDYQKSFNDFKVLFTALVNDFNNLVSLSDSLNLVFGGEDLRRYLLVFQNQAELRPTGGFMGSFAVLDIQKGKILNLDIPGGGSYDLQGQLNEYLKPPLPLQLSNTRWEFQDANWFPDFPASAKKIAWFYNKARNTTVDGVITINASVLERLLKILGPVVNENNNLILNSDNALATLQYKVEKDYDKEINQPKAILGDLAGQFLDKFSHLDKVNAVLLLTELHQALAQKEIQVYFNDEKVEKLFQEFNWTGEIVQTNTNQDYLAVFGTNLQGQKSDAKIKQVIEHQAVVEEDGSIIDTVIIHRKHLGIPGEMFYGVNNIQYLRVYVPEGSELLAAGGFVYPPESAFRVPETWYKDDLDLVNYEVEQKIDSNSGTSIVKEFGKTSFGNWLMVKPGEAGSVYFTYRLPFKLNLQGNKDSLSLVGLKELIVGKSNLSSKYSLYIQKQSGINADFSTRVIYPGQWRPAWTLNDDLNLAANGAEYNTNLKTDQLFGLVMEKINK
ncbi:MAG: hypothetical protein US42_C0010G0034 [Candidatus Magasanikbacteria bacterium GW2011_GWC2_37_14]|uniref:Uncharacterized protein n=1 Tax=Candidatus Magasanikbacteria bacterium GW2011_GWC2_37_14 TaxID=1619046 RepID=A0A0G0GBP3_9BACT|nr:MAG: hypothetical protein US42_C0010G0034 [Candidatus Magasanikbacteria bacterium GW2011_GWC2_37_14]